MSEIDLDSFYVDLKKSFDQRGWRDREDVSAGIVRSLRSSHGSTSPSKLAKEVSGVFLEHNGATRSDVAGIIERCLQGRRVVLPIDKRVEQVEINVGHVSFDFGKAQQMTKNEFRINNRGQIAGNIGSTDSTVNLENLQQLNIENPDDLHEHFRSDPEIRILLESNNDPEEKKKSIAERIRSKIPQIAPQLAISVAGRLVSEFVIGIL